MGYMTTGTNKTKLYLVDTPPPTLSGKLHIYCSVTAAYSHLPPLMDKFRRRHPEVEIILSTGGAIDFIEIYEKRFW